MRYLRAVLFMLVAIATVVPFAFLSILILPLPLHWRYTLIALWPSLIVWAARVICGIDWTVRGMEKLPDGPCILLSKHQSAWETCFFPFIMPRELCFVYKRELHYVPFFGWGLASLRMIHIDREKGKDAFESVVEQGSGRLAQGRWIIIFPEGTRVPVGRRGRYKNGGSRLAVRLGVPVVPIAHNAGECWPRNSFVKTPGLVTVSIGAPIATAGRTADAVTRDVETWIENEMQRINPAPYRDARAPLAA